MDEIALCNSCRKQISAKATSGFCRTCYARHRNAENPTRAQEINKRSHEKNKEVRNARLRELRQVDPTRFKEYDKKSWDKSREKRLQQKKEHWDRVGRAARRQRYHSDPEFRIKDRLRGRLNEALRKVGAYKSTSAVKDLGCTVSDLREYLEQRFYDHTQTGEQMTWMNYSSRWEIDHILPLASFDLTNREQLLRAGHYTNLQPLWREHNRSKSDKLDWEPS